jgi:(p)ppGpp synthase/HD superfamily hydrolase
VRKGTNVPYITHPFSVVLLLVRAGIDDEHILATALLHDVVEDTETALEHLRSEFPAEVVDYVAALSEEKRDEAGEKIPWQVRKDKHLEHMAAAPWQVRAVALADKLHNLATMLYDLEGGEELWTRFNAPPDKIVWYHREMIARAAQNDARLQGLATECNRLLARLEQQLTR